MKYSALAALVAILGCFSTAHGLCVADPVSVSTLPLDPDFRFRGLDDSLGGKFPAWLARWRQENASDPTPVFYGEDNCQNGIADNDHLDLLAAILTGEPTADVMPGISPASITAIRNGFESNRAKVRPDLSLTIIIVTVNIIDEINKDDPEFGASLTNLVAAYMTIGDAESVAFIRGLLITLGEIFIEVGVANGDIPALVEGATKSALRTAVTNNFVATRYTCFGDAAGSTSPNLLGDTGNIGGSVLSNEAEYAAQGGNRQAWLIAKGVATPPLALVAPPTDVTVQAGAPEVVSAVLAGGDGSAVTFDWKRVNETSGATSPVGTGGALAFEYPLAGDAGTYQLFVCDGTWLRASMPFTFTVTPTAFAIVEQPEGASRTVGESVTFSARAIGGERLPTYQWYFGADAGALAPIPGETARTLALDSVGLDDDGVYQVRITGGPATAATVLSSDSAVLTVADPSDVVPPVLSLSGDKTVTVACGSAYNDAGATASDDRDGVLDEAIVVSGAVDTSTTGSYTLTFRVEDAAGNSDEDTRTVLVTDTVAPSITLVGADPLILACKAAFADPGVTAADACDGDVTAKVVASGAVTVAAPGNYTRTYTVADDAGNEASLTRTVQVVDTEAPTITRIGPATITLTCGGTLNDPGAAASDACAGNISGSIVATGAVDMTTPGSYTRSYAVSDPSGNSASTTRTFNVVDTTPPALVLRGANPLVLACGEAYSEPGADALDACEGDLTASVQVSGAVNTDGPGNFSRTYAVADSTGNEIRVVRTVQVKDTVAPVLTLNGAAEVTVACGGAYQEAGASAADACAGNLNVVTTGTVDASAVGAYIRTYTATDPSGNSASVSRTVSVVDTSAPVLSLKGGNPLAVACGGNYVEPGFTATSVCEGNLGGAVVVNGSVDMTTPGEYVLAYSVSSQGGLLAEAQRTVRVEDTAAPVVALVGPALVVVGCGGAYEEAGATAFDVCAGDLSAGISIAGVVDAATAGDYSLEYSVADPAGNTGTATRTVRVSESTTPGIQLVGDEIVTVSCGGAFEEPGFTANDACGDDVSALVVVRGAADTTVPGDYVLTYALSTDTGEVTEQRTIRVTADCAIEVLSQPRSQSLYVGQRAEFFVQAESVGGTLTYQWFQGEDAIAGATSTLFVVLAVAAGDAGYYRCDVSNGFGVVSSDVAVLQVFERPLSGQQSADSNGDWSISLSELLRLVQFYNTGSFSCLDGTEDGYAPGPGDQTCAAHSTDYNVQDWKLILSELLRAIQFYNTPGGAYRVEDGTEDGFAPGAG